MSPTAQTEAADQGSAQSHEPSGKQVFRPELPCADAQERSPVSLTPLEIVLLEALRRLVRCDGDAAGASGKPGATLNGLGLVDLFDSVGHPFGTGEHKQQAYRSNDLEAALIDARAAIAKASA